jgi:F-type H+-transporting ATPase subunit gamma
MRNLAAVYVRRAESTLQATRPYAKIVETALDQALTHLTETAAPQQAHESAVAIVFASDQGLCGTFNEKVVDKLWEFRRTQTPFPVMVVGLRGRALLRQRGVEPDFAVPAPTSLEGITAQVRDISRQLFDFISDRSATGLYFVFNRYVSMGSFEETVIQVLPPDRSRLSPEDMNAEFPYDPLLTMLPEELLEALVDEYFFIQLFQALLESHASENGARLAAMTAASTNIEKRSGEIRKHYRTARQEAVTSELLDVVGGAEAMGM